MPRPVPTSSPAATISLALTIRAWITSNPGRHRPNEVAAAIPSTYGMDEAKWRQRVANEMARMARAGVLERGRISGNESGPGVLYWLAKDAPPLEQHTATGVTCSCGEEFTDLDGFKAHQREARNPKPKTKKGKR